MTNKQKILCIISWFSMAIFSMLELFEIAFMCQFMVNGYLFHTVVVKDKNEVLK